MQEETKSKEKTLDLSQISIYFHHFSANFVHFLVCLHCFHPSDRRGAHYDYLHFYRSDPSRNPRSQSRFLRKSNDLRRRDFEKVAVLRA